MLHSVEDGRLSENHSPTGQVGRFVVTMLAQRSLMWRVGYHKQQHNACSLGAALGGDKAETDVASTGSSSSVLRERAERVVNPINNNNKAARRWTMRDRVQDGAGEDSGEVMRFV